jgi:O-antigen/teichoic acid export membrane protein
LIGVVQIGVLSHYLGSKGFGEYSFVLSVVGICAMLTDMGLVQVAVRSLTAGPGPARSQTLAAVLVARFYLAIAAVVISDLFALLVPINGTERTGILLMSVFYFLTIPGVIGAVFQAELEMQFSLAISIGQTVIGLGLTLALIAMHASVLALLAIQLPLAALNAVMFYLVAARRYGLRLHLNAAHGLRVLRESLPVGISQILVVLYFRIDSVLLGLFRGPIAVAHYSAAYKFVDLAGFGAVAFMTAVYPLMARQGHASERAGLVTAYERSTEIMMFVAIPLTAIFLVLARPMILLVFPADFVPSIGALRILSLTLVPLYFNNVLGALVLTLHRERTFLWVSLGATLLNIGLNVAFIPAYGLTAASIITVVSEMFVTVVAVVMVWRLLGYIPSPRTPSLALCATVVAALPVYLLRDYLFVSVAVGGVVYLLTTRLLRLWAWDEVRALLNPR